MSVLSPDEARRRLHSLIDMLPDEQISLVWMAFQGMFGSELDDMDTDDDDDNYVEELDIDRM